MFIYKTNYSWEIMAHVLYPMRVKHGMNFTPRNHKFTSGDVYQDKFCVSQRKKKLKSLHGSFTKSEQYTHAGRRGQTPTPANPSSAACSVSRINQFSTRTFFMLIFFICIQMFMKTNWTAGVAHPNILSVIVNSIGLPIQRFNTVHTDSQDQWEPTSAKHNGIF